MKELTLDDFDRFEKLGFDIVQVWSENGYTLTAYNSRRLIVGQIYVACY